jgi:multiple sugar transport system permease protein
VDDVVQTLSARWRGVSKLRRREMLFGYAALIPYTVGFLVFVAGPLLYSLWLSFNNYQILKSPSWVGLDNYRSLVDDPLFWKSLQNTAIYSLVSVPLGVVIGYTIALLLNQKVFGLSFWRTIYYVPSIVPVLATSYLFSWMFNSDVGLVNLWLKGIGIRGPNWFGDPSWALPTFIIISLWGAGGGMVLYLAAMQGVPTTLYDAAKVDGASAWQRLWNVTIPMTSPTVLFMFMMGIIGSFQVFTQVFVISGGGPVNATLMYVLYLYMNGWQFFKMGYAAALAWVLFALILVLTLLTLKLSGRLVFYEFAENE